MAKFLNVSVCMLLAVVVLRVDALWNHDHDDDHHAKGVSAGASAGAAVGNLGLGHHDDDDDDDDHHHHDLVHDHDHDHQDGDDGGAGAGNGSGGCNCGSNKMAEFAHKFALVLRAYASKELGPEVQAMVAKLTSFTLNYLAQEKPEDMAKVNDLLTSSAKATSSAVSHASAKVDVDVHDD